MVHQVVFSIFDWEKYYKRLHIVGKLLSFLGAECQNLVIKSIRVKFYHIDFDVLITGPEWQYGQRSPGALQIESFAQGSVGFRTFFLNCALKIEIVLGLWFRFNCFKSLANWSLRSWHIWGAKYMHQCCCSRWWSLDSIKLTAKLQARGQKHTNFNGPSCCFLQH